MTTKPKSVSNPLYGKFDEVVDALVDSSHPAKNFSLKKGQPASPRKPKHVC